MDIDKNYKNEFHIQSKEDIEGVKKHLDKIASQTINKDTVINGKKYNGVGELDIKISIHHYT